MKRLFFTLTIFLAFSQGASAEQCAGLPSYEVLKKALIQAKSEANGGLGFNMWGTLVDRMGTVCAVVNTGTQTDAQWLGSRLISAAKANTANNFSLKGFAISTANLYSAVQPGGSLFGLQENNPLNNAVAFSGDSEKFGSPQDPLVGTRVGGTNVFGGGLALYNAQGEIVGAIGVSGDTSCADHNIAWRTRNNLNLDYVPAGVAADKTDQIIYDIADGKSAGGYGQPTCGGTEPEVAKTLPVSGLKRQAELVK